MDRQLIEHYIRGADELARAIRGLSPAERNSFPVPGTWSIQQIVMHMMDSDLIAADRMKRVIAEEHPTLIGYNETLFAKNLPYAELDAAVACDIFAKFADRQSPAFQAPHPCDVDVSQGVVNHKYRTRS